MQVILLLTSYKVFYIGSPIVIETLHTDTGNL